MSPTWRDPEPAVIVARCWSAAAVAPSTARSHPPPRTWAGDVITTDDGALMLTGGFIDTTEKPDSETQNFDLFIAKFVGLASGVELMRLVPSLLNLR